ncbi:uncharacterized protein LOC134844419 [Symsagittifera roscoffensis]|uniref:uncharacterized protein LOC134844419 n=1 Tax=Symsagittifera roscoffensis TaxID=84072 RepID=UPI00307C3DE3
MILRIFSQFRDGIYAALLAVGTFYLIFFVSIVLLIFLKYMGERCVGSSSSGTQHHLMGESRPERPRDTIHHMQHQQSKLIKRTSSVGGGTSSRAHKGCHRSHAGTFQLGAIRIK